MTGIWGKEIPRQRVSWRGISNAIGLLFRRYHLLLVVALLLLLTLAATSGISVSLSTSGVGPLALTSSRIPFNSERINSTSALSMARSAAISMPDRLTIPRSMFLSAVVGVHLLPSSYSPENAPKNP